MRVDQAIATVETIRAPKALADRLRVGPPIPLRGVWRGPTRWASPPAGGLRAASSGAERQPELEGTGLDPLGEVVGQVEHVARLGDVEADEAARRGDERLLDQPGRHAAGLGQRVPLGDEAPP